MPVPPTPTPTLTSPPVLTTTPTPTATPTPNPDNCPIEIAFRPDADDPATLLDIGWKGNAHARPMVSDATLTVSVNCPGTSRPCGTCDLGGPIANAGAGAGDIDNRRCTNNTSKRCTDNMPCFQQCMGGSNDGNACTVASQCPSGTCAAAGTCEYFLGSPFPFDAAGFGFCQTIRLNGNITGTVNIEDGTSASTLPLAWSIFLGEMLSAPCPLCGGDATPNDGAPDGICSAGGRAGHVCDANGTIGAGGPPSYRTTSLDCPPAPGRLLGPARPMTENVTTGTATKTLSAESPTCRGDGTKRCMCETCNNLAATPCFTNADCVAVGATICGGRRCQGGANIGAPCTVNSECPGASCSVPGTAPEPNVCVDGDCQPVAPGSLDGECTNGPYPGACAGEESYQPCNGDGDCPITGDCVFAPARCFLDNGVVGGSIAAIGSADPPVDELAAPTLATVFCFPLTGSSTVNNAMGLPGPARWRLRGTAVAR